MGKPDTRQPTITFASKHNTRQTETDGEGAAGGTSTVQHDDEDDDMRTLMREVRSSLKTIDAKAGYTVSANGLS